MSQGGKPVRFNVRCEVPAGCTLYVMGSIPELGRWNPHKALPLSLIPGSHRWQAEAELSADSFMYQYVMKGEGRSLRRESVPQRIADIRALPQEDDGVPIFRNAWEATILRFIMYYPLSDGSVLALQGDTHPLGEWKKPRVMELGPERTLMTGARGRCWELEAAVSPQGGRFEYRYGVLHLERRTAEWARPPNAVCWLPPLHVLENGMWEQIDVNFVRGMEIDEVEPYRFAIGPYLQTHEEVQLLKQHGITAVLNIQTDEDFKERWIDWDAMCRAYEEAGIVCRRFPIVDFDRKDLIDKLPGAADALKELLEAGHHVYVHCTAGMSRSCAVGIAYLAKHQKLDVEAAAEHVRKHRSVAAPDMEAVRKAMRRGGGFLGFRRPF